MDLQVPIPSIDAAVNMRDISIYKEERLKAATILPWNNTDSHISDDVVKEKIKNAFYFAMITIYAQGMAQLHVASKVYNYGLDLEEVAKIWRGVVSSGPCVWKILDKHTKETPIFRICY